MRDRVVQDIATDHDELAVSEIYKTHHTEDKSNSQRQERIETAEAYCVYDILDEERQVEPPR